MRTRIPRSASCRFSVIGLVATAALGFTLTGTTESANAATRLANKYAPVVLLARGDTYRPADATSFVKESALRWAHDGRIVCVDDHQVAGRGRVDIRKLGDGGYRHQTANALCKHARWYRSNELTRPRYSDKGGMPDGEGFFLDLPNERRTRLGGSHAPVYVEAVNRRFITYWFFYAFNDAPAAAADHEGDWERISIRLDERNRPTAVAYYQHDTFQEVAWPDVPRRNGRPVAYVASGTHAMYPRPGTYPLRLGAVDRAPADGIAWSTADRLVDVRSQGWYGFGGAWGEIGEFSHSTGPLGPSCHVGAAPRPWGPTCGTATQAGTPTATGRAEPITKPHASAPAAPAATPRTCHWKVVWPVAGVYSDPRRDRAALKTKRAGEVVGPYCDVVSGEPAGEPYVRVHTESDNVDQVGWMRLAALKQVGA
jgi:hypothetical protein